MKKLVLKEGIEHHSDLHDDSEKKDVERMVRVCAEKGFEITFDVALSVWEHHGFLVHAGWLYLPKGDDELFEIIQSFTDVVD